MREEDFSQALVQVIWSNIRGSFWFAPAVLSCAAILCHVLFGNLDKLWPQPNIWGGWLFFSGGAGAGRDVLATLATSMITVAGVIFSITIVVLTLASSQLGPRLIRSFMSDPANQWVLGGFIATFIYCVLVLRRIYGEDGGGVIPHISITFSVFLAIINSGLLIFYIHHIAVAIQADEVIDRVSREVNKKIKRMSEQSGRPLSGEEQASLQELFAPGRDNNTLAVDCLKSGYVQSIDVGNLLKIAVEVDGVFKLQCRAGDFTLTGTQFLIAKVNKNVPERFQDITRKQFLIGKVRTSAQDLNYSMDQIVEIALRALSPSLNDPFTAVTCIDKLSASVCEFLCHDFTPYVYDENGQLRLIMALNTFEDVLDTAFTQIRQSGCSYPAIVIRLLKRIGGILAWARTDEQRAILSRYAAVIHEESHRTGMSDWDKTSVEEVYREITRSAA